MIPFALYVHLPFCRSRCAYCDFNTYLYSAALAPAYIEALLKEARLQAACLTLQGYQPRTLYIGGGTPSVLPLRLLARLLEEIQQIFSPAGGSEITLEANPKTLSSSKLKLIKELGVNRLSLGVQSFDDSLLAMLKRAHSAREARETYGLARRYGFENINLDFIFGLPGQNLSTWKKTIEEAVKLAPAHLSIYGLTVVPQTPLKKSLDKGEIQLPSGEEESRMFFLAHDFLESKGWGHYEISNYALDGYQSQHNWFYWRHQEYLGLGAGAYSYLSGRRFANTRRPRDYIRLMEERDSAQVFSEVIDHKKALAENLMLALRTAKGLNLKNFGERFNFQPEVPWASILKELQGEGWLKKVNKTITLTPSGLWAADEITARLLAFLP